MNNIQFEITEEDILEYLKLYKDDYKFCEALFISYLKRNNITKEKIQILMRKYNHLIADKGDISFNKYYSDKSILFERKPTVHNDVDLSAICHILLPTLKYYGKSQIHINHLYVDLNVIAEKLLVPMEQPMEIINSTLDDYRICGKVETSNNDMIINIKMGREHCRHEILTYQDYYKGYQVDKIKKIVRERMK